MAIRKPNLSASEARRLAETRSSALAVTPPEAGPTPPVAPGAQSDAKRTPSAGRDSLGSNSLATEQAGPTRPLSQPRTSAPAQPLEPPSVSRSGQVNPPDTAGATPHPRRNQTDRPASSYGAPLPHVAARSKLDGPTFGTALPHPGTSARLPPLPQKIQVFLFAPLPAPGVSAIFEALCRQYSAQKALQMILRRALDHYEMMLESGAFQEMPASYSCDETGQACVIQTSRMIPSTLVAIARAHFDPLGMESTRSFGRKLATAALAAFFFSEGKRNP
ncbi:MAG: hypothetical protein EOR16_30210 [Mesorhizobium sp.]|uniref:VirC2 family conjugal transfer protein n=1 Tax=Mesorhizobium sp. TaxID=1871066 RepID=UPI000FE5D2A5|nr:VirC2 family conjugal transfer protein [Mesorhizobium sp.]RWI50535.1 MAG: hypothetical protein EOR16_30210 [Mesorhizobium sp.]